MENHFGIIEIDWKSTDPLIQLQVWDNDDTLLIEKNEFKKGEQIKTENNKWKLSDDYYKVL
jgi:hypothetical protein